MNSISKIILLSLLSTNILYGNRLKLKKADVLESKNIGKESVKFLKGNVEFQKGLVELKCDYGTHEEKEDVAHLFNNVEIIKETLLLTCDSITFYSKQNKVESTGNPKVADLEYNLKSDTLIYFTELDSGVALGKVELYQNKQKIKADRIEYIKKPGSNSVSYNAIGNVIIQDSLRTATCGLAIYNHTSEETQLEIKPKIIDDKELYMAKRLLCAMNRKN